MKSGLFTILGAISKLVICLPRASQFCKVITPVFLPREPHELYKKTKRLKLSIIPFENNPLSLLFNESGCYFKLMFCIQCENQDTTITSIEVTLKRQSDTWEKTYKWSSLDSIYLNWFGNNTANRINSATYARPYKIKENTLEPFIIEFLIQDDASKVNSECNANETSWC